MIRILITGGSGQVGTELRRLQWPEGFELDAPGRGILDLANPGQIRDYVHDGGFAAVLNPAACTAVDAAEDDVATAFAVNALGPAALADATRTLGIPLIHVSTDYVFGGTKTAPYTETDPIGPLGVYGASKEAGEQAVRSGNPRHVIMRTAWVFSPFGANFVKTMLRLGQTRDVLRVVDDQTGSPTAAADIAQALARITARMLADGAAPAGTCHFVNAGTVSWCGFAREIFRQAQDRGMSVPTVEAILTTDFPTRAARPANSVLSTDKIGRDYGISPRLWTDALRETMDQLLGTSF